MTEGGTRAKLASYCGHFAFDFIGWQALPILAELSDSNLRSQPDGSPTMNPLLTARGPLPAIAAAMLFAAGCATCKPGKPGPITSIPVHIELAPALQGKSVVVDLVGVNQANFSRWEAYSMTKYWSPSDAMRGNAGKKTTDFDASHSLSTKVEVNDPAYAQWKTQGAAFIFVLADLPGAHNDLPGAQDPRRQILSLDQCNWPDDTKELKVLIQESGIEVQTPVRTR